MNSLALGYLRKYSKLTVKVVKAMYGLIQSEKLWYNVLTRFLEGQVFKKCASDECVLVKSTAGGKNILVLLYMDDYYE
jgi:hypothetical protein